MSTTSIGFDIFARDRASDKFEKVGKSADGMKGKLATMAKAGALALGAVAVAAVGLGVKFTKMAIEDQAAQAKMAKALQNTTGATKAQIAATESWITKQGQALGVADDDLRPAISRLAVATGDLSKAQGLASLAMDVSAGTGKSLKQVTEALAKAQTGNLGGLSKLGVATKDAAGNTMSLDEITKNLAKTYSGQAATAAETTAGKFERLKLRMSEMQEGIGAKLIPVADKLAGFLLNNLGPALAKAGDWAQLHLLPPLKQVGEFIQDKVIPAARELGEKVLNGLKGFIDNVSESLAKNRPFIEEVGKALAQVGEFVLTKVVPALAEMSSKQLPILGAAIGVGITMLKNATTAFLFLGEMGIKSFAFLLDAALGAFGGILKAASVGLGWIPGIGDKIKTAEQAFNTFRTNTVNDLEAVANKLGTIRNAINEIPGEKTVRVNVVTTSTGAKIPTSGTKPGQSNIPDYNPRGAPNGRLAGDVAGSVEVVIKTEDGTVIERKLARLKRHRGGGRLAFE